MRDARRTGRRKRRWPRVLLGLTALVLVLVAGYVFTMYRQVTGTIDQQLGRKPLLPTQTVACPPVTAAGVPATGAGATRRASPVVPATAAGEAKNFVVVRRDSDTPGVGEPSDFMWAHVSNDRTRVDVVSFAPNLRLAPEGCPVHTLRDVYRKGSTPAVVAFLSGLVQVRADHVVEVDRRGIVLMKQLLDPRVLANPIGVGDAIIEAMSHIVFDESMQGDELQSLAFSLRDLRTTRAHTMKQPTETGSTAPEPLTATSPSIVRLRQALTTDSMAGYG